MQEAQKVWCFLTVLLIHTIYPISFPAHLFLLLCQ